LKIRPPAFSGPGLGGAVRFLADLSLTAITSWQQVSRQKRFVRRPHIRVDLRLIWTLASVSAITLRPREPDQLISGDVVEVGVVVLKVPQLPAVEPGSLL